MVDCSEQTFIQGTASKCWIRLLIFSVGLFGITQLRAAIGSDNAGNYPTGWNNADNRETGFGPWIFESNHIGTDTFAGAYLADLTNPGNRNSGIFSPDSSGKAFALYANPNGTYMVAKRFFGGATATPLAVGESFTFKWLQFWGGGNKGINLYRGGWDDTADKVLNLRQGGDMFLAQSRGSVTSATAIANAYNNLTTVTVRRAAPDTLILNIQTEDPADIPYSSTFRSPAPDRVSFYFNNGLNGNNDEPLFNNLSIDADSNPVETRQIKFSVNMGYLEEQSPKGFDGALGDKIYVRGYPSGGWGEAEKVELTQEDGGVYSVVLNVAGDTGLKSGGYKFYIEKNMSSTSVVLNSGYESSDEREFNLPVSNVDLPVVYFNNVSASRTITFAVNMSIQQALSKFDPALGTVQLRGLGSFDATDKVLTREGGTLIYKGTFVVTGDSGSTVEYKFFSAGVTASGFEVINPNDLLLNRSLTLGASGSPVVLETAYFSNQSALPPTFSGAYPGRTLTEVAPNGLTYLANYAFGGDSNTQPILPVQDMSDSDKLQLIVVYRTDDPTLPLSGLRGEATTDLSGAWDLPDVGVTDGDRTGLPDNLTRKVISVDRGSDPKKFLRATVTK